MAAAHVIVVGAGVGGLEATLALSALADGLVRITLVSADDEFMELPDSVAASFAAGEVRRHAIAELIAPSGAVLVHDRVIGVRPDARQVDLASGDVLTYDALILAVGAQTEPVYDRAVTFEPRRPQALESVLGDVELGRARRLAIVVPPGHHWTLPAYELALLMAAHAHHVGVDVELTLIVPEHDPLVIFGARVSQAARELLTEAGVTLLTSAFAEIRPGEPLTLAAHPGPVSMPVDRAIALPRLVAPIIPGINDHNDGFLAVDGFGRLRDLPAAYAVGDLTRYPIKQGGLAAQQADSAAADLAARFGASLRPVPFRPVLRGRLQTATGERWLRRDSERDPSGEISDRPLWWPPGKIAAGHLASALWRAGNHAERPPQPSAAVELLLAPPS